MIFSSSSPHALSAQKDSSSASSSSLLAKSIQETAFNELHHQNLPDNASETLPYADEDINSLTSTTENNNISNSNQSSNGGNSLLKADCNNNDHSSSESHSGENNQQLRSYVSTPVDVDETSENFRRCNSLIYQLLYRIQPSIESENHRKEVFDIISAVLDLANLKTYLYGSVAFKTYLPDGDIDLSVFANNETENGELLNTIISPLISVASNEIPNHATSYIHDILLKHMHIGLKQQLADASVPWYNKVRSLFQEIQRNSLAVVEDLTFINAEVKLIKCTVNNIPIDMSSGQVGGLSTLCFLHEVDDKIGDNHLFKRSIILMKSWSYYESRILGSHHGLVSTYGLTVLLMYMFRLYKIETPLQALYRFLNYYSTLDWTNFGISVYGPIPLSIIQSCKNQEDFQHEHLSTDRHDVLTSEFLKKCKKSYGDPDTSKILTVKNLNIVDPLRDFNNLGRSVNYNNFLRIRRAFKKGAKMLTDILNSTDIKDSEKILNLFFKNVTVKYVGDGNILIDHVMNEERYQVGTNKQTSASGSVFDSKLEDCVTCLETAHSLLGTSSPSVSLYSQDASTNTSSPFPVPKTPPRRSSSVSNFIASPLSPLNSYAVYTRNLTLMNAGNNMNGATVTRKMVRWEWLIRFQSYLQKIPYPPTLLRQQNKLNTKVEKPQRKALFPCKQVLSLQKRKQLQNVATSSKLHTHQMYQKLACINETSLNRT
ncbi:hypothetical protein C9374_010419 [Naegleria lovaniensis]|uniref:Polymerase nucleotidyl transferase domain-containing protein n=1 Tax=Naegleria lovaniensis TaxID=51637 RepID=A0AA88KDF8_NAELO|nr:uncharacterized protein C9374_010419 [Naegleria lovaniensis]KAG2374675.1 hypothetical protein C9374_010419 [Naegleria lovaniensis]